MKPGLLYQCTGCKEDPRCWYANPDLNAYDEWTAYP